MSFTHSADPLQRFPVFRTSDPEEFRHALLTRFGASNAEIKCSEGLTARGNLVQLQSVGLVYGQGSAAARADFPEVDRFRLFTALTGKDKERLGSENGRRDGYHDTSPDKPLDDEVRYPTISQSPANVRHGSWLCRDAFPERVDVIGRHDAVRSRRLLFIRKQTLNDSGAKSAKGQQRKFHSDFPISIEG